MKPYLLLLAGALLVVSTASAQDPKKTADLLRGSDKGSAATNPICKLFTVAEVSKYVGKAVGAPENAAQGAACQWGTKDYEGDMMVQVVAARYHEEPKLAKGFQRVPELGPRAFVVPELGGWKAATLRGEESIIVMLSGPGANQQTVIALLKDTLARRK